jgi:hypothetical protein
MPVQITNVSVPFFQGSIHLQALGLPAIPTYVPLLTAEAPSFLRRLIAAAAYYVDITQWYAS